MGQLNRETLFNPARIDGAEARPRRERREHEAEKGPALAGRCLDDQPVGVLPPAAPHWPRVFPGL